MNKFLRKLIPVMCCGSLLVGCATKSNDIDFCERNLDKVVEQTVGLREYALENKRIPRTLTADNKMHWTKEDFDWTEGFFPGTNWFLYEYTNDEAWKESARQFQNQFEEHSFLTTNHDLGFVFNCSYGQQYRLTKDEHAKQVLINAANSLITRFNPTVGCIQSWDVNNGWQAKRNWQYPVIIDNMMNLELLFEVSKITGDKKYADVAIAHANTTLLHHFRADNSSYHVIDYDSISGQVRKKETAQGFAHESAWSRGQAWGIYGYTVCYRYTKDPVYLDQAIAIAEYIINNPLLPKDHVPYWDYNAPLVPNEPRDASAAAVTASALVELCEYTDDKYLDEARFVLESLSSDAYFAAQGANSQFVLKHSVGSIPHNSEIDKPLSYADYYYVEALLRLRDRKE